MSRKVFTAGQVLAAADVNNFLMDQTVMSFAGTAARGSAIGTAIEGMVSYLEDSNLLTAYNGSAWVTVANAGTASYNLVQTLYFTSSGTFTKATYPWLRAIRVKLQAGGGGGGGINLTPTDAIAASNGGGGGTYGEKFFTDIASLASSVTVTVGAGGAGGNGATQSSGATGGTTSFHNMSVTGGAGAFHGFPRSSAFSEPYGSLGGNGGVNMDVLFPGKNSGIGMAINYGRATFQGSGAGGNGGDSYLGRGGRPGNPAAGGVDTGLLGGGGGGRNQGNDGGTGSQNGAAGGAGIVILELYA
jgi:hypothetical protein